MKKTLVAVALLAFASLCHAQLAKQRLFKVDPLSFMFKELRVSVEHRVLKDYFVYIGPYGYHQFWRGRADDRYDRPGFPQKYYGLGLRLGARRYLFPAKSSPHGFFVQAHLGLRQVWMHNFSTSLELVDKSRYNHFMFGGTVGYQWIAGPRKDFAYGFIGGFEQTLLLGHHSSTGNFGPDSITSNWYEFPFLVRGPNPFRLYLGIEVGFAFLQKHLHW